MERDMSFVLIENIEDSVFKIDYWIKKTRNESSDEKITPDFAMKVLTKTNHFSHINIILNNIGEKCCSIKERLEYKEFVLSAIEGREQTKAIKEYLRDLAKEGGYEKEFDDADSKKKVYGIRDYKMNYFIEIKDSTNNLLQLDAKVKKLRHDQALTPDAAKEILAESGHFAIVKSILKAIENQENVVEYKDFMLSCVCGREITPNLSEKIENIAKEHGFYKEFKRVSALPKVYNALGAKIEESSRADVANSLKSMSSADFL